MFEVSRFPQEQYSQPVGDPGLFGPSSVTWRVHADGSMIVGGFAALLVQTLHPLVMAGVADHSDYREAPLRRLSRTASFIGATTYGSTPVAESVIRSVRGVHKRIVGTAPDGRPYTAEDPELLRWVHVAGVACFARAYRAYGFGVLTNHELDRYYDEVAIVAEKLGATGVPRSRREVASYFRAVRPQLRAGEQAREAVRFLTVPPSGEDILGRIAYDLVVRAAIGVVPRWVREALGLARPLLAEQAEQAAVRPAVWTLLRALRLATGPHPAINEARARCRSTGETAA